MNFKAGQHYSITGSRNFECGRLIYDPFHMIIINNVDDDINKPIYITGGRIYKNERVGFVIHLWKKSKFGDMKYPQDSKTNETCSNFILNKDNLIR